MASSLRSAWAELTRSPERARALSAALITAIAIGDYGTRAEGSFTLLYLLPIVVGTVYDGRSFGLLLAVVASLASFWSDPVRALPDHVGQLGVFTAAALVVSRLGTSLVRERQAIQDASTARNEALETTVGLATARAESQRLLRAIEQADESILITDLSGRIEYVNPAFTRISGYRRQDVLGRNPRFLQSGKHEPSFYRALWETILAGKVWRGEIVNRRKDGGVYVEETSITPVHGRDGITHFIAIKQDVTERKKDREALERMQFSVDHAADSILWVADDAKVVYANESACRNLGYSRAELIGMAAHAIAPELDRPPGPRSITSTYRRKDGSTFAVELTLTHMAFGGEEYECVIARDLSARLLLEEQFRQAQKMEVGGRLAGGVAHDFNNLLGVIIGYSEILLRDPAATPGVRSKLEQILMAGQRGTGLTRQLLAFSRKQVLQPKVLDLNAVVEEVRKMLGRLIGEDIELTFAATRDLGQVKADPGQVEQVLLNLAVNARDAMPTGGNLTIATSNVEIDEAHAFRHPGVAVGRFVMLTVADTGCGMNAEVMRHLFEPFFTTKEQGKGTGLGLATVYGIVTQSGGHLEVESDVGRGSAFKIYLPRVDEPAVEHVGAVASPLGGSETVLLVEDEATLRETTRELLEASGYAVLPAADAAQAMAISRQHAGRIHLLLSDVVMPGTSGPELAKHVRFRRPEVAVLYMTGYTDAALAAHGLDGSGSELLVKPFSAEALTRKVREALGAAA
jgi:PAS domain S-box-containing protein